MGWFDDRKKQRDTATRCVCRGCGEYFWLPPSKVGRYVTCSAECDAAFRDHRKAERARSCEACGVTFIPRPMQIRMGVGRYCSQKCNVAAHRAVNTRGSHAKAGASYSAAVRSGAVEPLRGSRNGHWRGGSDASYARDLARRRTPAGRARVRAYMHEHPELSRNRDARRRSRKGCGRLEYGAIGRIGSKQRWRCAICRADIRRGYHVDHIVPLARGGAHAERNIQLLCAHCNLTKAARDPIADMQRRGFLL